MVIAVTSTDYTDGKLTVKGTGPADGTIRVTKKSDGSLIGTVQIKSDGTFSGTWTTTLGPGDTVVVTLAETGKMLSFTLGQR